MKQFLSIVFFAALALAGCTDSDEGIGAASQVFATASEDSFSLSSDAQVAPQTQSVTVECVKNSGNPDFKLTWKLASSQSWLKLTLDPGGSVTA